MLAETHYLDTYQEMSAKIWVEPHSFAIRKAIRSIYRSTNGAKSCTSRALSELVGVTAYFEANSSLSRISWEDELERSLFTENISAVILAEGYLWQERGFESEKAYEKFWYQMFQNSCYYFSNLDRRDSRFSDILETQNRYDNLFSRYQLSTLYTLETNVVLSGTFSDPYHELGLVLKLDKNDYRVISCHAQMLRAPHDICPEAIDECNNLIKKKFWPPPSKRDLWTTLGRQNACIHLVEVVFKSGQTLKMYENRSAMSRERRMSL